MQTNSLLVRFLLFSLSAVARLRLVYAMVGDSISGATDSVIISTGGLPVVSDGSFSQPVSAVAVEFVPTRVPAMSVSSRSWNTFAAPAPWDNPLRPRCDRDVPEASK